MKNIAIGMGGAVVATVHYNTIAIYCSLALALLVRSTVVLLFLVLTSYFCRQLVLTLVQVFSAHIGEVHRGSTP